MIIIQAMILLLIPYFPLLLLTFYKDTAVRQVQ
jgi:hypothetical protein